MSLSWQSWPDRAGVWWVRDSDGFTQVCEAFACRNGTATNGVQVVQRGAILYPSETDGLQFQRAVPPTDDLPVGDPPDRSLHIPVTFGYLLNNVRDWDEFCRNVGLNPWLLQEGRGQAEDLYGVSLAMLAKHLR